MSQDKELEIQLQFLDEAEEYLSTIEAALLGLSSIGIDSQKINAALRAAHSVKGGAAMMGFQTLSQLAHRLEDCFKVLKVQKSTVTVDAELERLLLASSECLHQVIAMGRHHRLPDPQWLAASVLPIFDQLHDRLGDPQAEDANSVLSPEDGQDIIPLLFETEVEGCLQRLETALQMGDPCLREEVEILAQELGGLGEMLQLTAFTQLCHSIAQHLQAAPDRTLAIADAALQAWRRSQALVMTGNLTTMPQAIAVEGIMLSGEPHATGEADWLTATHSLDEPLTATFGDELAIGELDEEESIVAEAMPLSAPFMNEEMDRDPAFDGSAFNSVHGNASEFDAPEFDAPEFDAPEFNAPEFNAPEFDAPEFNAPEFNAPEFNAPEFDAPEFNAPERHSVHGNGAEHNRSTVNSPPFNPSVTPTAFDTPDRFTDYEVHPEPIPEEPSVLPPSRSASHQSQSTEFRLSEDTTDSIFTASEGTENTVRVPMRHLNQLNDLLGELTIERHRLDLHLKRLRSLIQTLSYRVQILDQSNTQLRASYDRVETQVPLSSVPLLPAATETATGLPPIENYNNASEISHRFDSLELDRYNEQHLLSQEVMETIVQIQEVTSDIELGLDDTEQTNRDLHKTSKQLQTSLGHVRMRPLSDILDRFPRAIRELSLQHHKPVELKVQGDNTLVDRNILEALNDPLLHLIRNAFDHGIESPEIRRQRGKPEQGVIQIQAFHRSNRTIITIRDDGGGIPIHKIRDRARRMGLDEMLLAAASDEELLSLIFEPGFSTTDQVTDLSGRGIGMDVVRNNLKQVRGEIRVNTQAGLGTTFTLSVPFTLSIARVLLAESSGMILAFPTDVIEEMVVLQPNQVVNTIGNEAIRWQNTMVQMIRLSRWLNFHRPQQIEGLETPPTVNTPAVLILNQGSQHVGLQIDRCWGEQEVAIRKVEGNLPLPPGFNNCTILGDGRVVPLINISELLRWIASRDRTEVAIVEPIHAPPSALSLQARAAHVPALVPIRKPTILVVDDSINVRRLLALTLEKAGYQVAQAKDGQDALDKLIGGLQVQAVICDIEMPRLDGYGFLARMKATPDLEQLPVAMLTSRSGNKHRQLAMNLGATAYFSKPYNEQSLLQTLEQLVDLAPAS